MASDLFLLIPAAELAPPVNEPITRDNYFAKAFPKAVAVEVREFSFGSTTTVSIGSASAGAGAGKLQFNPLSVAKDVDRLSPSLFAMSTHGTSVSAVQLFVRKAGMAGKPYLAYEFKPVFVTALDWSAASGDDVPTEHVTFMYGALSLGYYTQNPDGTLGQIVKQGWSQVLNKPPTEEILVGY
jgi:type VI secretion system secreted protein Hcp